jgi:hypothetical protein
MINIQTYLRNMGASSLLSLRDVGKGLFPTLSENIDRNSDVIEQAFQLVQDTRKIRTSAGRMFDREEIKLAKTGFKNAIADLKSGNLYNEERMEADAGDFGGDGGFDESAFGGFDESAFSGDASDGGATAEESSSEGSAIDLDKLKDSQGQSLEVSAVTNNYRRTVNVLNRGSNGRVSDPMMQKLTTATNARLGQMLMTSVAVSQHQIHALQSIDGNLNKMQEFNLKHTTEFHKRSIDFYNIATVAATATQAAVEDIAQRSREQAERNEKFFNPRKKESQLESVYGSDGSFDFAAYHKLLLRKFDDDYGMFGNALGDMVKEFISSPLSSAMTSAIESSIPAAFRKAASEFDEVIAGIPAAILTQMNAWADDFDSPFLQKIGQFFGMKVGNKNNVNLSSYEKGEVPFDGMTRKSIVEVIPSLLAKILAAVKGEGRGKELIYDYDAGRFNTRGAVEREFEDGKRTARLDSMDGSKSKLIEGFNRANPNATSEQATIAQGEIENALNALSKRQHIIKTSGKFSMEEHLKAEGIGEQTVNFMKEAYSQMSPTEKHTLHKEIIASGISMDNYVNMRQASLDDSIRAASNDKLIRRQVTQIPGTTGGHTGGHGGPGGGPGTPGGGPLPGGPTLGHERPETAAIVGGQMPSHHVNMRGGDIPEEAFQYADGFMGTLQKIYRTPFDLAAKAMRGANVKIAEFFFGHQENPQGFLETMKLKLFGSEALGTKGIVGDLKQSLNDKVVDPLKRFLIGERDENGMLKGPPGFLDQTQAFFTDKLFNPTKEFLFGQGSTDADGNTVGKGILNSLWDGLKLHSLRFKDYLFREEEMMGEDGQMLKKGILKSFWEGMKVSGLKLNDWLFGPPTMAMDENGKTFIKKGVLRSFWDGTKQATEQLNKYLFGSADLVKDEASGKFVWKKGILRALWEDKIVPGWNNFGNYLFGTNREVTGPDGVKYMAKGILRGLWEDKIVPGWNRVNGYLFGTRTVTDENGNDVEKDGLMRWTWKGLSHHTKRFGDYLMRGSDTIDPETGELLKKGLLRRAYDSITTHAKNAFNASGEWLFGKTENGVRTKDGIFTTSINFFKGEILDPLKHTVIDSWNRMHNFFMEGVVAPLKGTLQPFITEFKLQFMLFKKWGHDLFTNGIKIVKDTVDDLFRDVFGRPLTDLMKQYVIDPLKDALRSIKDFIGNVLKNIILAPVKLIRQASDSLRERHKAMGINYDDNRIVDIFTPGKKPKGTKSPGAAKGVWQGIVDAYNDRRNTAAQRLEESKKRAEEAKRKRDEEEGPEATGGSPVPKPTQPKGDPGGAAATVPTSHIGEVERNPIQRTMDAVKEYIHKLDERLIPDLHSVKASGDKTAEHTGNIDRGIGSVLTQVERIASTMPRTHVGDGVKHLGGFGEGGMEIGTLERISEHTRHLGPISDMVYHIMKTVTKGKGPKRGLLSMFGKKGESHDDVGAPMFFRAVKGIITSPVKFAKWATETIAKSGLGSVVSSLIQAPIALMDMAVKLTTGILHAVAESVKALGSVIAGAAQMITAGLQAIGPAIGGILGTITGVVREGVGLVAGATKELGIGLAGATKEILVGVGLAGKGLLNSLGILTTGIAKTTAELLPALGKLGKGVLNVLNALTFGLGGKLIEGVGVSVGKALGLKVRARHEVFVIGGHLDLVKKVGQVHHVGSVGKIGGKGVPTADDAVADVKAGGGKIVNGIKNTFSQISAHMTARAETKKKEELEFRVADATIQGEAHLEEIKKTGKGMMSWLPLIGTALTGLAQWFMASKFATSVAGAVAGAFAKGPLLEKMSSMFRRNAAPAAVVAGGGNDNDILDGVDGPESDKDRKQREKDEKNKRKGNRKAAKARLNRMRGGSSLQKAGSAVGGGIRAVGGGIGRAAGGLGRLAGGAARLAGKAFIPLSIAMGAMDTFSGAMDAGKTLGKAEKDVNLGDRIAGGLGGLATGLSLGLLDRKQTTQLISGFMSGSANLMSAAGTKIVEWGKGAVKGAKDLHAWAVDGSSSIMAGLWTGTGHLLSEAGKRMQAFFTEKLQQGSDMLGLGVKGGGDFASTLGGAAQSIMGKIGSNLSENWTRYDKMLGGNIYKVGDALTNMVTNLLDATGKLIGNISIKMGEIVTNLGSKGFAQLLGKDPIATFFGMLISPAGTLLSMLIKGMSKEGEGDHNHEGKGGPVSDFWTRTKEEIVNSPANLVDNIKNIVVGNVDSSKVATGEYSQAPWFASAKGHNLTITSAWGAKEGFRNSGHKGWDFAGPMNTPLVSQTDGVITSVYTGAKPVGHLGSKEGGGWGNHVIIQDQNGAQHVYAHLASVADGMRTGRQVRRGEIIGYLGTSGRSTGPHLHYEIIRGSKKVNPAEYFAKDGAALLAGSKTVAEHVEGAKEAVVGGAKSLWNMFESSLHKNEGGAGVAYKFSDAQVGTSGLSFGRSQFDIKNGNHDAKLLAMGFSKEEIARLKGIRLNKSTSAGDRAFVEEAAKRLQANKALIDQYDNQQTGGLQDTALERLRKLPPSVKISNPSVVAQMADAFNQYGDGISFDGVLNKKSGTITPEDFLNWRLSTLYGRNNPRDARRRYENIQKTFTGTQDVNVTGQKLYEMLKGHAGQQAIISNGSAGGPPEDRMPGIISNGSAGGPIDPHMLPWDQRAQDALPKPVTFTDEAADKLSAALEKKKEISAASATSSALGGANAEVVSMLKQVLGYLSDISGNTAETARNTSMIEENTQQALAQAEKHRVTADASGGEGKGNPFLNLGSESPQRKTQGSIASPLASTIARGA